MHLPKLFILSSLALAIAVGCGDDDDPPERRTAELIVDNQTPPAIDVVQIDRVYAKKAGFISIVQAKDGSATAPEIGLRTVAAGESENLTVAVERPLIDDEELYARLHEDSNGNGEFEWTPGGDLDPIVSVGAEPLERAFTITSTLPPIASILVDDQSVSTSTSGAEQLIVKSAVTSTISFIVIEDQVSTSTKTYAAALIQPGLSVLLPVVLTSTPSAQAGLSATLYRDEDDDGVFDAATDVPILVEGEPVRALFMMEGAAP